MTPEILAPAGSMEALKAAVNAGADAVYLGAGHFNARRNAANFTESELSDAVRFCHIRGVKVHLALNTLISDKEIPDVLKIVKSACALGIDAFIVQDLGLAEILRNAAPDVPLHASTQVSVMTAGGFKELEQLGFTRAVLPRELTFEEIKEIRKSTTLELEAFVHGALCMCVSGQCYLSSMIGGRSGNRGLCAQPCRLAFAAPGGTGHDLSLKDLSIIDYIPQLFDSGVVSFKIEGRMKRPEYVAAAVKACKNAATGISDSELKQDLQSVFSRSGFTDGYLADQRGLKMFGTRGKDDVAASASVLSKLKSLYSDDAAPNTLKMHFKAKTGAGIELSADGHLPKSGRVYSAAVSSDFMPPQASAKPASKESVAKHLAKLGGTAWHIESEDDIKVTLDDGLFLPASEINSLRRRAISDLEEKISEDSVKSFDETKLPKLTSCKEHGSGQYLAVRFADCSQIPKSILSPGFTIAGNKVKVILPYNIPHEEMKLLSDKGLGFGLEIPRGIYGERAVKRITDKLKKAKETGARFVLAGTLDGVHLARSLNLPVIGGYSLNCFNSYTASVYRSLGVSDICLSAELRISSMQNILSDAETGIFSYGHMPLMLSRNCPVKNGTTCKECNSSGYLTDRKNVKFPVRCINGVAELLNTVPTYMGDKQSDISSFDFQILYFTVENAQEVSEIIDSINIGKPLETDYTRGLYYRGTL